MKSVFMVLFLLGGLAISNADAQSCQPASKASCAAACKPGASADANAAQTLLPGTAALAGCTPEQMASCTPEQMAACAGKKMSKKEMQECQAKCQGKVAATPTTGQAVLAGQPATVNSKPVAPSKSAKQ